MRLIPVQSLDDPRLRPYATMRDAELRHREDPTNPVLAGPDRDRGGGGAFMAEGELVVRRLIESRFAVESVLLTPTRLRTVEDALTRLPPETPIYLAEQGVMNAVVGFNIHRGILAVGLRGRDPDPLELARQARTLLVLEDLVNHDNLGAMFRNAAALGGEGTAILLSPRCADPLYRKALRVSVGYALHVPFARASSWPGILADLRAMGFHVLALTGTPGAEDIVDVARDFEQASGQPRLALLFGTEGAGLTPEAMAAADRRVRIAMAPGVDSLNVAVAAAVALHRLVSPDGQDRGTPGPVRDIS